MKTSNHWGWYWIITLFAACVALGCMVLLEWYMPKVAKDMYRWIAESYVRLFVAFSATEFYLVYRDWRMDGKLFHGITQNPLGCAIFGGLSFLAVVLLCIGR